MERGSTTQFRREIRLLVWMLVAFVVVLVAGLLAAAITLIRMDRVAAIAEVAGVAIDPIVRNGTAANVEARLELLRMEKDIARVEVYRDGRLWAASGERKQAAHVITRTTPGGHMQFYFETAGWTAGRRTSLIVAASAMLATTAGLLVLILYLPKFVRPVDEMLRQARRLGGPIQGDDDARYLVHTFREAVERVQDQARELDDLRDAATSRAPEILELARALNHNFTSGFLAVDDAGLVVAMNDAGRRILGLGGESRDVPYPLSDLPPAFASVIADSFDSRSGVTRREVVAEGGDSLHGVTTVPLFDGDTFLGMFALFTDLTSFRAMEGRLRDMESLVSLGQMSAGIAHEFRNSLFTILGYLQLAQRSSSGAALTKIQNAETEARKLASAVDALLGFARPLEIRSAPFRLDELARSLVRHFEEAQPSIRFVLDAEPCELKGDRELLERALENVVRNAVDAVRQQHPEGGGRIEVSVRASPHAAVIVRDNGTGLDPKSAATLLLPFQSGKSHGFGLGLPLARKIVLHHGGTLELSGELGKGATVTMEFFADG